MKKSLIAASASAVALAAMPIVGVFATTNQAITDQVQITVSPVCAMRTGGTAASPTTAGATLSKTVNGGTLVGGDNPTTPWDGTPSTFTITCNDTGGWKITAQGVTGTAADATPQTVMKASNATSTDIVTGTETSGNTSNWAFKVTGDTASGYTTFSEVPGSTPAVVATSADPVYESTVTANYRAWVSTIQEADTYTGYVKYVLTAPLN